MENQRLQNIIYRYFRGQLNDGEYDELITLLQNESNRKSFETAKKEWELSPELGEDGLKNLARLNYQINKKELLKSKLPLTHRLWVQITSVAAVLVIGILMGVIANSLTAGHSNRSEQLVFETPRGEKSMVKLPDGTEVWLNANSRLVYNSFTDLKREVELTGEAYFKVSHNETVPFIVKTNECSVKVLGTTFNVMAYDEFGRKEITLIDGKVNVLMEGAEREIQPGQALILADNKFRVVDASKSLATAWVENKFEFNNIPITELMKRLEYWYDVDINLVNNTGKEVSFTGTFKNEETIWQVLEVISNYTPMQYEKTELRKITLAIN